MDPDRRGSKRENFSNKNKKNARKLVPLIIASLFKLFQSKSAQAPLFLTFQHSFMFFTNKENYSQGFFNKLAYSGSGSAFLKQPDPHSKKLLDPDPQKMNADPQP